MVTVDRNTCGLYMTSSIDSPVCMSSIKQTNIQQYVEKDCPLHLDEVYTCELGLGGGFAPKPGAAEQYKVAHFGYRMRIGLPNSLLLFFSVIFFLQDAPGTYPRP